jgi:cytidylate kinase
MKIILTGAHGTGKTTLMNALAKNIDASKDSVKLISHIRKTAIENGIDLSNATAEGRQQNRRAVVVTYK